MYFYILYIDMHQYIEHMQSRWGTCITHTYTHIYIYIYIYTHTFTYIYIIGIIYMHSIYIIYIHWSLYRRFQEMEAETGRKLKESNQKRLLKQCSFAPQTTILNSQGFFLTENSSTSFSKKNLRLCFDAL